MNAKDFNTKKTAFAAGRYVLEWHNIKGLRQPKRIWAFNSIEQAETWAKYIGSVNEWMHKISSFFTLFRKENEIAVQWSWMAD